MSRSLEAAIVAVFVKFKRDASFLKYLVRVVLIFGIYLAFLARKPRILSGKYPQRDPTDPKFGTGVHIPHQSDIKRKLIFNPQLLVLMAVFELLFAGFGHRRIEPQVELTLRKIPHC